jgi:hypothetical protein
MAIAKSNPALWETLAALPLDRLAGEPGPANAFVFRLMRQEEWDYTHTVRVVAEYRRFLYLSTLGEVSPPADVDTAWHLHLTYTRAYWTGLCQRTLGKPLDHTPASGGEDALRYRAIYEETRRRYREEFGAEPPRDIWPDPATPVPATPWHAGRFARNLAIVTAGGAVLWLAPTIARMIGTMTIFLLAFVALVIVASAHNRSRRGGNGGVDLSFEGDSGDGGGGDGGGCGGGCGG